MAAYVRGVLASLLSKYVTLSEEELTVNLWQGRVELRDVALNVGALSLPLRARASVRTLALEVPWTRLMAASVRLVGSGLRVDLDDFSDQSPVLGPAPTAVSPTPPPPPPTTPPPQEVAVLLRRVKQLAVLELTDVVFVVRERIRVRAEKLTGGPFGQMDDDLAFEAGDLDFSHCLQLLDLTIEIDNVMVLHPVSVEVVLSFSGGGHLSYCNVVVSEELKLCLSDEQILLLVSTCEDIFAATRGSKVEEDVSEKNTAPSPPHSKVSLRVSPPPSASPVASSSPTSSWTSSIWKYGMSWVSSATSASPASPAKRLTPRRPPSSNNLMALETASPGASSSAASSFLPSWFRLELPKFCLELSSHSRVAVGEHVHHVLRPLLRLCLYRNVVEWSQSPLALELIARVGNVTASSLLENPKDGLSVLVFDSLEESDAVSIDWVHRLHDRFVNVVVEPLVFCLTAPLIRELSNFAGKMMNSEATEEELRRDSGAEVSKPQVTISVLNPRVWIGDFELVVDSVRFSSGQVVLENLSMINRTAASSAELLLPVSKLTVDVLEDRVVVKSEGVVTLRYRAPDFRALMVAVDDFAAEISDDLVDLDGLFAGGEGDGVEVSRKKSRKIEVELPYACVHIETAEGSAVADALMDKVVVHVGDGGVVSGWLAGLVVLDRADATCGRVLCSSFAADGAAVSLFEQAYSQMASKESFAVDLVFSSPAYKSSEVQRPVSFSYKSERVSLDNVPTSSTSIKAVGLGVYFDKSAFGRLSTAASNSSAKAAPIKAFSAARLKWIYVVHKAVRLERRRILSTVGGPNIHHGSWKEFCSSVGRSQRVSSWMSCGPRWLELSSFLRASASNLSLQVLNSSVVLLDGMRLSIESICSNKMLNDRGFAFDWITAKTTCTGLKLVFPVDVVACVVKSVSIVASTRLNGRSSTVVDLGQVAAKFDNVLQLSRFREAFESDKKEEPAVVVVVQAQKSVLQIVCGPVMLEVGSFEAVAESLSFSDGEVLSRNIGLHFKKRPVVVVGGLSVALRAFQIVSSGLRVIVDREALDEVLLLVSRRDVVSSGRQNNEPQSWFLAARDSCITFPVGKLEALHCNVQSVKGLLNGELNWKAVSVYFGNIGNCNSVIGGMLRLSKASTRLSPRMDVVVGKVEVRLVFDVDLRHVRALVDQLPDRSDGMGSSSSSPVQGRFAVKEVCVSVDAASVTLDEVTLEWNADREWSGSLGLMAVAFEDQSLVIVRGVARSLQQNVLAASEVRVNFFLSQAEMLGAFVSRLKEQFHASSFSAQPGSGASSPSFPSALRNCKVPEVAVVMFAFPGSEAVLELRLSALSCFADTRSQWWTARLAECHGLVLDAVNGVKLQFLDAQSMMLRFGERETELICEEPVCISLSAPVLRCFSAIREGSASPVFPFVVENATGYPLILSGGRRCDPNKSVGVERAAGLVHILIGGSMWTSNQTVDFAALSNKRSLELESAEGDSTDLSIVRLSESSFRLGGRLMIVNATELPVHVLHCRPLRGSRTLCEIILPDQQRVVSVVSDKGKEEDDDGMVDGDHAATVTAQQDLLPWFVMTTTRSQLRFRCGSKSKWSEQQIVLGRDDAVQKSLVECGPGKYVWCSSLPASGLRLSAVAVLENHLPCSVWWASTDGRSRGLLPSGAKAQYFGKPDDTVFGFSVESEEHAVAMNVLVDCCSKARSFVRLTNAMSLNVVCFTIASTQTRQIQLSCPVVLSNLSSFAILIGSELLAGNSSTGCDEMPKCIGAPDVELEFDHVGEVASGVDDPEPTALSDVLEQGDARVCCFKRNGVDQEVIVRTRLSKQTRTRVVEVLPCLEIVNESPFELSFRCQDVSAYQALVRGTAVSLPPWILLGTKQPATLRLRCDKDGRETGPVAIEFGTVKLVRVSDELYVMLRTHFRAGEEGFPRVVRISILEPFPTPFVVRNLTNWVVAVQEQWVTGISRVEPKSEIPLFPSVWFDYLDQQRESLEEAVDRLTGGDEKAAKEKKSKPKGSAFWDDSFPASIRKRPFVFRVRMDPGGNWSELIESSRPHFFSMTLYSESGLKERVDVSVSFVGLTKVVCIGGTFSSVPKPLMSWKVSLAMLCVRASGLLEVIAKRVGLSKRGVSVEFSLGEVQAQNLVPNATYPLLLFQLGGSRPALTFRVRLGHAESSNLLSKVSLSLSDLGLELDYGSLSTLLSGLAGMFKGLRQHSSVTSAQAAHHEQGLVDEVEVAPFVLLLSWQNPKILIPLQLWDEMLSIRHLRLSMPGLNHTGCSLAKSDLKEILINYSKEAFLGQTVRILGSLDVLGNPTGLITAFGSSVRFLQSAWTAAIEGDGHAMVEGASDAVRSFAGALMTPLVSLSNASARIVGDEGALGAIFDLNRRTIEFVSGYLSEQTVAAPPMTQSPFKKERK